MILAQHWVRLPSDPGFSQKVEKSQLKRMAEWKRSDSSQTADLMKFCILNFY